MRMHKGLPRKLAAALLCGAMTICSMTACEQKKVELDGEAILNFTEPEVGEKIAVLTIKDYGDVKIKLFADETPKGVENFTTLIENGYYDELIFHRVMSKFMIQSGDPKGDGTGGEDCWNSGGFAQTLSPNLHHFAGAVAYATASDHLNGSQFFIVTGDTVTEAYLQQLASYYGIAFSETVQQMYATFGGAPHLDNNYEVFGQVFEGLEYCLEIQNVPVAGDPNSPKPVDAVVIEKAQIVEYDGSGCHYLSWDGKEQQPQK